MHCPEYLDLLPKERIEMLGKIVHALQSDSITFASVQLLIKKAERKGLFEGVTINPIPNDAPDLNQIPDPLKETT